MIQYVSRVSLNLITVKRNLTDYAGIRAHSLYELQAKISSLFISMPDCQR